ncbi:DNA-(apurinic or apyrimidinic site) lyase, variant 3 [Coprinopsis cinerea AmutBmut pab1-1]|nr:DNA-(apurinic or apyrimidinic site) lyase, variant 3 [Coprinopsis cinerea AmutBmut pab1-1]
MPPKSLSRSATKRKVEDRDTDTDDAESQPTSSKLTKKPKKTGTLDSLPHNGQPTNKTLPVNIEFEKPDEGTLRIATWNVCGLAASMRKGFKYYVEAEDADILVLTETKVNDIPADPALKSRYPHQYWSISDKKTYAGTAILSKVKPLHVDYKLPGHPNPKGRILTLEFENAYLIGTYVVNAGQELKTMDAKKEWQTHFEAYIRELDKKKPVIWTGDLNVAPTEKGMSGLTAQMRRNHGPLRQICKIPRKLGTNNQGTLKLRQPRSRRSLPQKTILKGLNLLTCGGNCIPIFSTTHIGATASKAVKRAMAGGLICLS